MEPTCPICGCPTVLGPANPHRPFCSNRCKMIDLDRWFSGDYRIPGEPVETDPRHTESDPAISGERDP